jgi:hypothetical protein
MLVKKKSNLKNYPSIIKLIHNQSSLIGMPDDKNHNNCWIPFVYLILLKQVS